MGFVRKGNAEPIDLSGMSLVLPAVSAGHVEQLALDLFLASLPFECIGYFDTKCVIPMCGNDAIAAKSEDICGNMCVSVEVYLNQDSKTVIVQQRSPVIKGLYKKYSEEISSWVSQCGFSSAYVLTGFDAANRIDVQLVGSQLRYAPFGIHAEQRKDVKILEEDSVSNMIPKGALSRIISESASSYLPVTLIGILIGVDAQQSIPFARELAKCVAGCIDMNVEEWINPISWGILRDVPPPIDLF